MELQDDGTTVLKAKNDNDDTNTKQKWTRKTVDEYGNWFIWSNAAESNDKFLAAPVDAALILKGIELRLFYSSDHYGFRLMISEILCLDILTSKAILIY